MNGRRFRGRSKAVAFRKQLFNEHFGLPPEEQNDVISEEIWQKIRRRSSKNAEIYREIFRCYPDDCIGKVSEIQEFIKTKIQDKNELKLLYEEKIKGVVGHAVQFPLNFLKEESHLSHMEVFDIGLYFAPKEIFS